MKRPCPVALCSVAISVAWLAPATAGASPAAGPASSVIRGQALDPSHPGRNGMAGQCGGGGGGGGGVAIGSRGAGGSACDPGGQATVVALSRSGLSALQQFEAFGRTGEPPDTDGAIGRSYYVEAVNSEIAAFDRHLRAISAVDLTKFVSGVRACDPQIKFDPHTNRWFYVVIRCDLTLFKNRLYLGFSKTSSPLPLNGSGWCDYSYDYYNILPDYPKLGLDGTHIMIGINAFKTGSIGSKPPEDEFPEFSQIAELPEPAAGAIRSCPPTPDLTQFGTARRPLRNSLGHEAFTPEPATVSDSSTGGFIVSADQRKPSRRGAHVMVWQMTGSGRHPALIALGAPRVPAYAPPANVPQPGYLGKLDTLEGRLTGAIAARDPSVGPEAVWTQHTISAPSGSQVRWYEIVPGSPPFVRQVGSITDPAGWAFNGAIAPTSSGGAVISYNTGGPSQRATLKAQSRVSATPLGTMNNLVTLSTSSAIDSCPEPRGSNSKDWECRWGDYAAESVDPTNSNYIWGSNEVQGPRTRKQAGWKTQNFVLRTK